MIIMTENIYITRKKEELTEEELIKVEKLERKCHRAILAIKKDKTHLAKKWKIIKQCREDLREIMGTNYISF